MGSPLGLVFSSPTDDGVPSLGRFGKNKNYKVVNNKSVESLFTGGGQFSPFPKAGTNPKTGSITQISTPFDVHGDDVYDLTIPKIVEYCQKYPAMKLDFADFAYLKNLGVYPNNRLIVARRFPNPVKNDLTSLKNVEPMATLISWAKDDNFIDVTFGEVWDEADAGFTDVLNNIGKDIVTSQDLGNKIGDFAAAGIGFIPFRGWMEGIIYEVLKKLGVTDTGANNLPLGNPNLIRKAKARKTATKEIPFSGLTTTFTIKMDVEYEQKFINGVDPTLVYLDIIQNALTFGTSDAQFQFNSAFAEGTSELIKNLVSGNLTAVGAALAQFVQTLIGTIKEFGAKLLSALTRDWSKEAPPSAGQILWGLEAAFTTTIGSVIGKYKVRLIGIVHSLTGSPSMPWHVTIGNPKRPIFCSGDMEVSSVTLTVGKPLAFNDLPSSIKVSLSLQNARPLGAQEIFNRFNTGIGRSYVRAQKSFVETGNGQYTVSGGILELKDAQNLSNYQYNIIEKDRLEAAGEPAGEPEKAEYKRRLGELEAWTNLPPVVATPVEDSAQDDLLQNSGSFGKDAVDWLKYQSPEPAVSGDQTNTPVAQQAPAPSESAQNNPDTPTAQLPPPTSDKFVYTDKLPLEDSAITDATDGTLRNRLEIINAEKAKTSPDSADYATLDQESRKIQAEITNRSSA